MRYRHKLAGRVEIETKEDARNEAAVAGQA
jgi:hypothetical protein